MSTANDYWAAKGIFETHTAQHGCKPKLIAQEQGLDACPERERLWNLKMQVARGL